MISYPQLLSMMASWHWTFKKLCLPWSYVFLGAMSCLPWRYVFLGIYLQTLDINLKCLTADSNRGRFFGGAYMDTKKSVCTMFHSFLCLLLICRNVSQTCIKLCWGTVSAHKCHHLCFLIL